MATMNQDDNALKETIIEWLTDRNDRLNGN